MPNWLLEILAVIAFSRKTQLAIILGMVAFVVINLVGSYMLHDFELHGPMKGLTNVIKQQLEGKYDKVAWGALLAFWGLAIKFYRKDKKRLW